MSEKPLRILVFICVILFFGLLVYGMLKNPIQPKIDASKTDSMQVFYSKQLDSIKVENQLLQVKIEAKTETIRTLKGLVKENNEKINPNNSVPILDSLRRSGFGKD